ncbi:MAG: hypothetical protein R3C60_13410 [Parvularculaceae bacterium]
MKYAFIFAPLFAAAALAASPADARSHHGDRSSAYSRSDARDHDRGQGHAYGRYRYKGYESGRWYARERRHSRRHHWYADYRGYDCYPAFNYGWEGGRRVRWESTLCYNEYGRRFEPRGTRLVIRLD